MEAVVTCFNLTFQCFPERTEEYQVESSWPLCREYFQARVWTTPLRSTYNMWWKKRVCIWFV